MLNISTETVTPHLANQYLATVTNNRKISRSVVDKYVAAMKRGEWRTTGQPIIFDGQMRMIDGQHRCKAIAASGIPVELVVVRGAPDGAFAVIDEGKRRSGGDVVGMAGKKNTTVTAAAARGIEFIVNGSTAAGKLMTNSRTLEIVRSYPSLQKWAELHAKHNGGVFTSSFVSVLTMAALRHGDATIMRFADMCYVGTGLNDDDPAFHLRNRFISQKRGQRLGYELGLALYIKAVNAHVQGKPMHILKMAHTEEFPSLV